MTKKNKTTLTNDILRQNGFRDEETGETLTCRMDDGLYIHITFDYFQVHYLVFANGFLGYVKTVEGFNELMQQNNINKELTLEG